MRLRIRLTASVFRRKQGVKRLRARAVQELKQGVRCQLDLLCRHSATRYTQAMVCGCRLRGAPVTSPHRARLGRQRQAQ